MEARYRRSRVLCVGYIQRKHTQLRQDQVRDALCCVGEMRSLDTVRPMFNVSRVLLFVHARTNEHCMQFDAKFARTA